MIDILLSPRFKSFYWRTGAMFLAGLLSLIAESLDLLDLGPQMTVITGLILGELTKALNNLIENKPLGFSRN